MARARFASIDTKDQTEFLRRIAPLIRDAATAGQRVAVFVSSRSWASRLDSFLWSFDQASFIPHSILGDSTSPLDQVIIVPADRTVIANTYINLTQNPVPLDSIPQSSQDVEIIEFVRPSNPESVAAARRKWDEYRACGVDTKRWNLDVR